MAILLIGSTGNGKSTLGNFLVNPEKEHIFGEQQTFKTARTNKPETQEVQSASLKVEKKQEKSLSVIDTPGIFEDEDKDIEHMVNIIRALHTVGSIRAIILVVKFSSKIDTPYKASVKYYSKLLPGLFETNLITVMTDYACDERSKNLRALQGINEEQIKKNILVQLGDSCGISAPPKLFTIDCLPMSEQEFDVNNQSRNAILQHALKFKATSTRDLKVAKTDAIMAADRITIATLEGEVTAHDEQLEQALGSEYSAKTQVQQYEKRLAALESDIEDVKSEVSVLDTKELVEGDNRSIRMKWKWFKVLSEQVEVPSKWPIRKVNATTQGHCRWVSRNTVSECSFEGRVKGKLNRSLNAKVVLEVYKCDKHAEDLAGLRDTIATKEELFGEVAKQHEKSKEKHQQITAEVAMLKENIKTKKEEISRLSSEYLTMEECLERFQV
jgi:GTPase Era involved in 16S rRNA processing